MKYWIKCVAVIVSVAVIGAHQDKIIYDQKREKNGALHLTQDRKPSKMIQRGNRECYSSA